MTTITCPTTELAVGQTIVDRGERGTVKRHEIRSVRWSRRAEYAIVNDQMVYSYGGTYERDALAVAGERVADAFAGMVEGLKRGTQPLAAIGTALTAEEATA